MTQEAKQRLWFYFFLTLVIGLVMLAVGMIAATFANAQVPPPDDDQCTSIPQPGGCDEPTPSPSPSASPTPVPTPTPEITPTPEGSPTDAVVSESRPPIRTAPPTSGGDVPPSDDSRREVVRTSGGEVEGELAFTGPVDPLIPILGVDFVLASAWFRRRARRKEIASANS